MNNMLDNAAACRPYDWALERFAEKSKEFYANQESAGYAGVRAAKAVAEAAEQLSSALAPGYGVFFCNTGTEALRTAVLSVFAEKQGSSLTTPAEHPALLHSLKEHSRVRFCKMTPDGTPVLSKNTAPDLFAIHHVNAETGRIQDPSELRKLLPEQTAFLLDTTQSVCKIPVPKTVPDFLTLSGCKIGAPCGAALLYRKPFEKRVLQIRAERHAVGRCVPAAAIVLAEVVSRGIAALEVRRQHAEHLQCLLRNELSGLPLHFTLPVEETSPYILHLTFPEFQGAILVRMLQAKGISVAAGSACSSETPEPSPVLRTMGYSAKEAYGALRISFFDDTTEQEIIFFANTLKDLLKNY